MVVHLPSIIAAHPSAYHSDVVPESLPLFDKLRSMSSLDQQVSRNVRPSTILPSNRYNSPTLSITSNESASIRTHSKLHPDPSEIATSVTLDSMMGDQKTCIARSSPLRMLQKPEVGGGADKPSGRGHRVRKLTSKALELHYDDTSNYYASSNTDHKHKSDQNTQSGSNSRSTSPGSLPGSKRKRSIIGGDETTTTPVKRIKQEQKVLSQKLLTPEDQKHSRFCNQENNDNMSSLSTSALTDPETEEKYPVQDTSIFEKCINAPKTPELLTKEAHVDNRSRKTRRRTRSSNLTSINPSILRTSTSEKETAHTEAGLETTEVATPTTWNRGLKVVLGPKSSACFITLRLPSTKRPRNRKGDFVEQVDGSPMKANMLTSVRSSDPDDVRCEGSCIKTADPSLLLYTISKVMAQMTGEGAEGEDNEPFDIAEFQEIMKDECLCNESRPSQKNAAAAAPSKYSKVTKRKRRELLEKALAFDAQRA